MAHRHHRHHHMSPEEEEKLIEEYKIIVDAYDDAKSRGSLPEKGTFEGLKGNLRKDWEEQIHDMKARIERHIREHGKKGRNHHR